MDHSGSSFRRFPFSAAIAAFALAAGLAAPAFAQTTSGNSATGATLFAANCNIGCHGATPLTNYSSTANGANAGGHISYARSNGMPAPALTSTEFNDIAAYIGTFVPDPSPTNVAVTFNTAKTGISIPNIYLSSTYGGLTSLASISASKGIATFAGTTATYTPNNCAIGADTVTFHAIGPPVGGQSSDRTFTVNIANPATGPTFTSGTTATATTGNAFTYSATVSSCSSIVTWSLPSAPAWLTINSSGQVTGSPPFGTEGTSPTFTVNATYPGGAFTSRTVTLTISLGKPTVTSSGTAPNGAVGIAYPGYQITATNGPPFTGFGASGLPPGLNPPNASGLITGTPTANGTFIAMVTASNSAGTSVAFPVTFNIAVGVPVVTPSTFSGQTGVAFSNAISATNSPTAYSVVPAASPNILPPGLALNAGNGQITGTPTAVGTFTPTIQATNGTGPGTAVVTFNITLGPPVITSLLTANAGVAVPFNYTITATNSPTSFNATGLPSGLSVDTTTGVISGSPTVAGTFNVTISATNGVPLTGNATLVITIATVAPVVTSPTTASGQTGVPFTYQITAINGPTAFNATGLPPGLTVNTATGLISGTPTTVGTFNATVSASNGAGGFNQPTVFTITLGPPVITSPATAGGAATLPFSYQITATNGPTSFNATGLPAGLSVSTSTGLISGTPTANGTFSVTVSATNATGTGNLVVTFTIGFGPPVISSPVTAGGSTGQPFAYQIVASGVPTSYNATGLPAGLSVNTATGLISGTPLSIGVSIVTLSATNGTGTGTLVLTITITLAAPGITSPPTANGSVGQAFSYQITASNSPTSFAATGLPPGLAVNTSTGVISGTPTAGGTYNVTVSATNATGTATQIVAITIAFVAPGSGDLAVQVLFQTATAIKLPVTGQFTLVNIVTLPAHGLLSAPVAGSATLTYTPANGYSGSDSFTYSVTGPGGVSPTATVTITVPTFRPVVTTVSMTVPLNTPTTLDLLPFITGSGVTGVTIPKSAAHGTVAVNGTSVTYTPRTDFFGTDTFTFVAFGNAGTSDPGVVNVTVIGRPDPSKNATVIGLLDSEAQTVRRFSRAQVTNYQRRLESLHVGPPAAAQDESDGPSTPAPAAAARAAPIAAPASPRPVATMDSVGTKQAANGLVPVSLTSTEARPKAAASGPLQSALANTLVSAASTQTVDVSSATGGPSATAGPRAGTNVWTGGLARFGDRGADGSTTNLRFSTDGITIGADRRISDRLALGLGIGYGRDHTDIGTDGSKSKATGTSFAGYGSYQPTRSTFVDAVLGFGSIDFDTTRYVASVDEFATGRRKGTQYFGSVAAGYEMRRQGVLLSPYGRLDFSIDKLKDSTESGAGLNALTYQEQTLRSAQAAAGLRLETRHETDFGWVSPRVRVEYRRELENARAATINYADQFGGLEYSVTPSGTSRNSLLIGVGTDFLWRRGLKIGIDYQGERSSGPGTVQSLRFLLSQELDGKMPTWSPRWSLLPFTDPIDVQLGYTFDDNVGRGRLASEKFSDQIYTLGLTSSREFPINENMRAIASGTFTVDKFHDFTGLGRTSGGLQGEVQYRASGDFDAITYALFARGWIDGYDSSLRSGRRLSMGLNARRSLTDRIDAFGEIGVNWRRAESAVFGGRDYAAKFNLDYTLGAAGTAYLAGEFRRGDTFSSGFGSLGNLDIAQVFVRDDAFPDDNIFAYRAEARMLLGTLGYNRPLGPRDSIDFSYRRVQTTPLTRPENSGPSSYIVNQYSILYLMRF